MKPISKARLHLLSSSILVMEHCFNSTATPQQMMDHESDLNRQNIDKHFRYLDRYGVLVCIDHRTGVWDLAAHLRDSHLIPLKDRKWIIHHFSGMSLKKPEEIQLPGRFVAPIPELGDPLHAFECAEEGCKMITASMANFRKHCKKEHRIAWTGDTSRLYHQVKVQTFFRSNGRQRYFIVAAHEDRVASSGASDRVRQKLSEWEVKKEERRKELQMLDAEIAKHDRTGWHNRTEWPKHLKGRNLHHLASAIQLPRRGETKLLRAQKAVELLVERCVLRLVRIPHEIRRWLRSAKRDEPDVRPLARLQNPESQSRYAGYMVMFICHVLRVVATSDSSDSGSDGDSSAWEGSADVLRDARQLFPWHGDQKELAWALWDVLDKPDESDHVFAVIALVKSFLFFKYGSSPLESGLVHFLSLLGIDPEMGRIRRAEDFSYRLAGVVYCVRVIGVNLLLRSDLGGEGHQQERDHFLDKRKDYLADGSFTPMSEMLSLLAFSKKIAMNSGNSGSVFWSKDKKTFYLNGRPILIERFQAMARDAIDELEDRFWRELVWVEDDRREQINLKEIVDDVTFTKRGCSFVSNSENQLADGLEWMMKREGERLQVDGGWDVRRVKKYLRRVTKYLELLLFAVHVTSGQPGRGTEITSMRHRNGCLQDRNMFVVDGDFMTVTRYHKSASQFDKPKVVPRFLPPRLGQLLVLYLARLQPFQEYLTVHVLHGGYSDYVWADEQGPWGTDRLTRILKQETGKRLGEALSTNKYRHTAVGIGREKVARSFAYGYQDEVDDDEEPEVDEGEEDVMELQNGRSTSTGQAVYSVPINIIKHLSSRSIETFRPLSMAWHRFLGVDERNEVKLRIKMETPCRKRKLDDAVEDGSTALRSQAETQVRMAMQHVLQQQEVSFKSYEQELAIRAVVRGDTPLVVVLPTGGGKTLLFTVPACMPNPGVTLVVMPFRELLNRQVRQMQGLGIDCVEWRPGQTDPATVVVVSADLVGERSFGKYAALLDEKRLLRRVVVDEAHLIFTASHWRRKLARLRTLRTLTCPMLLLSATIPRACEDLLSESMNLRCATYIRASTVRPNTRYMVSWCGRGEQLPSAVAMCRRQQYFLTNGRKGVVYCNSKDDCEALAEELGCQYYHADVPNRTERIDRWLKGGGLVIATSALGTGVDFPRIVFILHVGMPWSMIDFAQESGRGGRAGEFVTSVILVQEGEVERRLKEAIGDGDVQAIGDFIRGGGCRRAIMSEYLDDTRISCNDIESAGCDRCGEGRFEAQFSLAAAATEWEVVQAVFDELAQSCPVCWLLAGEGLYDHAFIACRRWTWAQAGRLDEFRRGVMSGYGGKNDGNSCFKCGISQLYCATRHDTTAKCQWPNVIIPLVLTWSRTPQCSTMIGQMGFDGGTGGGANKQYQRWLGRRCEQRVWGEYFSNAMVLAIQAILWTKEHSS